MRITLAKSQYFFHDFSIQFVERIFWNRNWIFRSFSFRDIVDYSILRKISSIICFHRFCTSVPYTCPRNAAISPKTLRTEARPIENATAGSRDDWPFACEPPRYPTVRGRTDSAQGEREVNIPAVNTTKALTGVKWSSCLRTRKLANWSTLKSADPISTIFNSTFRKCLLISFWFECVW